MKIIRTLAILLLLFSNVPAKSQNWCCCQIGCIQDIFFIGCDAFCAGLGGGINHGIDSGYPDPTCGGLLCPPSVPIELSYFEASVIDGNRVLLKWKTESEVNNRGFEIYRSNSIYWERIGFQKGKGTTTEPINYDFVDVSPSIGKNLYMLKQIDFDGTEKLSEVIQVTIESDKDHIGELFPNPSQSGLVNLQFYTTKDASIRVWVYGLAGQLLIEQTHSILMGDNYLRFDFSRLGSGMYVVHFETSEGRIKKKFIIP